MTDELAAHRPDLLRHCYRMLGSYADAEDVVQEVLLDAWKARASYAGDAPLGHWLMRIATNACLNEIGRRKRRALPQAEGPASAGDAALERRDPEEWLTPAADAPLATTLELRESVALAFVALLQRLPPKQRAVLLLKDVLGWSAEEIADALELTVGGVSSALHRARETMGEPPRAPGREPPPETVRAYIRSWESHDIDGLLALVREDLTFAMPPFATWFRGRADLERFLRGEFAAHWDAGFRLVETRANGCTALGFYRGDGNVYRASSIQVLAFDDGIAEIHVFIGPQNFRGFALPEVLS